MSRHATERPEQALTRRRDEAADAWTALRDAIGRELGWLPRGRLALLVAAGAVGLALAWARRRRRNG